MLNAKLCGFALLILVAGCTTQPAKDPKVANAAGDDRQCTTVRPTGSLIGKTICTTAADRAAQQAEMDDLKHVVTQNGCVRAGGEGC
jgi:hypothetical protein